MFPTAAHENAPWIIILAIIGIVYGALVAMVQPNMKKLVAYSSVSHLGFVVLGIFSFTQMGLDGAVYQMLNHGISTGRSVHSGWFPERTPSLACHFRLRRRRNSRAVVIHNLPDYNAREHRVADAE